MKSFWRGKNRSNVGKDGGSKTDEKAYTSNDLEYYIPACVSKREIVNVNVLHQIVRYFNHFITGIKAKHCIVCHMPNEPARLDSGNEYVLFLNQQY